MSWIFKKSIAFENIYSLVFFWLLVLIADTFADFEYVYMLSAINISACQNHRATGTVHRRTHEKHTHTHTREKWYKMAYGFGINEHEHEHIAH